MAKQVSEWIVMVRKMKAIYHTLNMLNMDVSQKCLIGECWVPLREVSKVQAALIKGGVSLQTVIIIISIYWTCYVAYVENYWSVLYVICNIKE